jgi:hypothetical protein
LNDGNAWLSVWIEAMRRGEDALWKKALHSMVRTKFLTPSIIAYNRWVLKQLPRYAILFTNGDMDTYPAIALQVTEGFRTDVAIVNISLLNMPWYARFINRHYNIPLPFKDQELDSLEPKWGPNKTIITISNQIIAEWFKQKEAKRLSAPIAIGVTVDMNLLPDTENHLKMAGPYSLWLPDKVDNSSDTTLMRMSIESIQPRDFTGPFISAQDRSPIRIGSERGVSGIVVHVIMNYANTLIEAKRFQEASRALDLAENIDKNYVSGRMFSEQITKLREMIGK